MLNMNDLGIVIETKLTFAALLTYRLHCYSGKRSLKLN